MKEAKHADCAFIAYLCLRADPQERLEHQHRPQRRAVILSARCAGRPSGARILVEDAGVEQQRRQRSSAQPSRAAGRAATRQRNRKAHLVPVQESCDRYGSSAFLKMYLPSPPPQLQSDGRPRRPLHELMVQQRHAHLERVRHAGAVDLGQDVARQLGLQVDVLDQRQRIVGRRAGGVAARTPRSRRSPAARA